MILLVLYCLIAAVLFIAGIILIIVKASRNEPIKTGLKMVIASVIMVVIGAGACALILSNLNFGGIR